MDDPPAPEFDPLRPPRRAVTVDVVVLTVIADRLLVVLDPRGAAPEDPFPGRLSLPGTFMGDEEQLLETALRVLHDKVGLTVPPDRLSRVGVYDRPDRDPRMRTISVAFSVFIAEHDQLEVLTGLARAGSLHDLDAVLDDPALPIAFDHRDILVDAREHACVLLEETNAALEFLPPVFTISQLREIYEVVWRTELNPGNFIKRVTRLDGFIEEHLAEDLSSVRFAGSPTTVDADWILYRNQSPLERGIMSSPAGPPTDEQRPLLARSESRSGPSKGRPPRHFVAGGSRRLQPTLRRPGSYFSRPSSQETRPD